MFFLHTWLKTASWWTELHVQFWSVWLAEKFGTQLKDVKTKAVKSKPVKRNVQSTFLRIFVSAVGLFGNLLCLSFETKMNTTCAIVTVWKRKSNCYISSHVEFFAIQRMQPQPLNRKHFPVLKHLLTMNFCGMVIEGVNCEISFIPITKEFHWFNGFVVIFTV